MAQLGRPQNTVMAIGTGPACHPGGPSAYPNIIATISVLGPGLAGLALQVQGWTPNS
jgi:hypothetical protein